MRTVALLAACSAIAVATAACGGSSGSSPAPEASASSTASVGASAQPADSGCGGFSAGTRGVVRVFCGGTGRASVTIGTKSKQLSGGACAHQDGQLAVNFGVVTGPDFPAGSPKPDYVGALIPDGSATAQAFTAHIDGIGGLVVHGTATVNGGQSAMLRGALLDGDAVSVDVTC